MRFKFIALGLVISVQVAAEGIATDGTLGVAQTLNGTDVLIPQTLGKTEGNNLFHSFSDFNIDKGQIVTFTGADNLQNVISRVTGENKSIIDGTLKSDIKNADFYFINPNGITFNANASVDVPAAFHVTTADKMDFGKNGGVFYADLSKKSQLSSESPVALGFLGTSKTNNGLLYIDASELTFKPNRILDIVAKNIQIENQSYINAMKGNVRLIGIKEGTVTLSRKIDGVLALPESNPTDFNAGNIAVNNSDIYVSGNGAGDIAIWSSNLFVKNSRIWADNIGLFDSTLMKNVEIHKNTMDVNFMRPSFANPANNLTNTGSLKPVEKTGNVFVNTKTLKLLDGGEISSNTLVQGDAGEVTVTTEDLIIDGQNSGQSTTGIYSNALPNSAGNAGSVNVTAKNINLNAGAISSDTFSEGNAGKVIVKTDNLNLDNAAKITSNAYQENSRHAGLVDVTTKETIIHQGVISSSTFGSGNAGTVHVTADNQLIIDHREESSQQGMTGILSGTVGKGNAGSVFVNAGELLLISGDINSNTLAQGNAGKVNVNVDKLTIGGHKPNKFFVMSSASNLLPNFSNKVEMTAITAKNLMQFSTGVLPPNAFVNINSALNTFDDTKIINVNTKDMEKLTQFSGISSSTLPSSTGKVGEVVVNAKEFIQMGNNGKISIENLGDSVFSEVSGNINVMAPNIKMKNAEITSHSIGNASAGDITVNALNRFNMNNSFINTTANTGDGGSIKVNGGELIYLKDSGFKTTVSGEDSNGGDISVKTPVLVMDTGLIQANAVSGNGGNINLAMQALIPSANQLLKGGESVDWDKSPSNVIQAASKSGVSGTVNNSAPQMNLSGVLANIGNNNFDNRLVSQDYCSVGKGSSLSKKGKSGLPLRAKDLQVY
jgi:filamentous hemagglutinin family protein